MDELTVTITQERYNQLCDIETRVAVLISHMRADGYMGMESAYRTLGYDDYANELKTKRDKEQEERLKKYGQEMEIDE